MRFLLLEHGLAIEVGRRAGLPRPLRMCRLCGLEIEDEVHVLLWCEGTQEPSAATQW